MKPQKTALLLSGFHNDYFLKENPRLSWHFKPTALALVVKNYGVGVSEEEQPNLFQPFFRQEIVQQFKVQN